MSDTELIFLVLGVCAWSILCFYMGYQQKQDRFKYRVKEIRADILLKRLKRGDSIVFSMPPREKGNE